MRLFPVDEPGGEGLVRIGSEEDDAYWLCLNYRSCGLEGEPAVVSFEVPEPGAEIKGQNLVQELAPSFECLVEKLVRWSISDCFGIVAGDASESEVWKDVRGALLLTEYSDSFYAVSGFHSQWESVPSATDGVGPAVFDLEANEQGTVIQFPEQPECSWLVYTNAHPRHREEILTALRSGLRWKVKPLHYVDWSIWAHEVTEPLDHFERAAPAAD